MIIGDADELYTDEQNDVLERFDGLGVNIRKIRKKIAPKRAAKTLRGDELLRAQHKRVTQYRPTQLAKKKQLRPTRAYKALRADELIRKQHATAQQVRPTQVVNTSQKTRSRVVRAGAAGTTEAQSYAAHQAAIKSKAATRAAIIRARAKKEGKPPPVGYGRKLPDTHQGTYQTTYGPQVTPIGAETSQPFAPGAEFLPDNYRDSNVVDFFDYSQQDREKIEWARGEYVKWVANNFPDLYDAALAYSGDALNGLGQETTPTTADSGSSWGGLIDAFKTLAPEYLKYQQQKKIMKMQQDRADRGLPPLETGQIAPTVRVQPELTPETKAELMATLTRFALPIVLGAAVFFGAKAFKRKGRR